MLQTLNQKGLRRLKVTYGVALAFIALTILASAFTMLYAIRRNHGDSRVINLSGRQRMLSQRLTKCVLALDYLPDGEQRATLLKEISESLPAWKAVHLGLQHGDQSRGLPQRENSAEVKALFAELTPCHLEMAGALERLLEAQPSGQANPQAVHAIVEVMLRNEARFLKLMDRITFLFDQEANARMLAMQRLEWIILLVGLVVLGLEVQYVFRPVVTQFTDMIKSLKLQSGELEATNLSLAQDITARKQAETELARKERQFRFIFEAAQVGLAWRYVSPDGRSEFLVNDAHLQICGLTLEAARQPGAFGQISHPDDIAVQRQFEAEIAEGKRQSFELEKRYLRRDGQTVWVNFSTRWHKNPDGSEEALSTVVDITARKQAETEIRQTNTCLEEAIAHANQMALQAELGNAAKSEFLANMSHEIRTPMNGVIGMAGLLLDTELTEDQRRYAETVCSSGETLMTLLNDILDFSKIEAGKLELETLDIDLRGLLEDLAGMVALRAHNQGLEFICDASANVPNYLRGDAGRLRQILLNLTGNALKFTQKGEVVVRVELAAETTETTLLRFSIRDTGIGIPDHKKSVLFQKFTQVDASTTRQYGGTGLGLAISKQLAELMGGQIGFTSEVGKGSEFWFTVKLGKQASPPKPAELPLVDVSNAHILIVDDNATNREVLRLRLGHWGVRVAEAPEGMTALQMIRAAKEAGDPYQAAILDMQMPGMDGAALATAIRADGAHAEMKLILMTSLGHRQDAAAMAAIGFSAYLVKPTRQSELLASLSTVLATRPASTKPRPIAPGARLPPLANRFTGRKARILLAEDNITNQMVALAMLKNMGLRADVVANGQEAVKALETLPYDLVLMDAQMPEMDGATATRQIRSAQSRALNPKVPIIAMTAGAMAIDRANCLDAGMDDYIAKPVSIHIMADTLARWLPACG